MTDQGVAAKPAGTRFPFVNLKKALERGKELFDADPRGREMSIPSAFSVWKYSDKSSGGHQTIAALKMYGILRDSNAGDSRKVALTDKALRYFRDERIEEKEKLAREFALTPKLIIALWDDWHTTPPADTIARSHLKADRGLNDQAARSLLAIYKENLAFAGLKGSSTIRPQEDEDDEPESERESEPAAATPLVFPRPRPSVHASPPAPPQRAPIPQRVAMAQGERELTSGLLSGGASFRLIVSGTVGVKEIDRLIRKLEIDKEILAEAAQQRAAQMRESGGDPDDDPLA